ncbi:MAG: type IV pilus secretin PilQ [Desulfurivibrionaceae bacterium]
MTHQRSNSYKIPGLTGLVAILAALILSACADKGEVQEEGFFDKWKAKVEESRPKAPRAQEREVDLPERQAEPEPDSAAQKEARIKRDKKLPSHRVTLQMREVPIDSVIRALSRSAEINVMLTSKLQGKINISVTDTPWDQVFQSLLATRNLDYEWQGDIIRVIGLADMKHEQQVEATKRAKIEASRKRKEVEPLLMRIIRLDYADAESLQAPLKGLLTSNQGEDREQRANRGSVFVDKENNALIIHALAGDITKMNSMVEKLDRPTRQVLIEANIVETTRDVARELGVQWGGLYRNTVNNNDYWLTPGLNSGDVLGDTLDSSIDPESGMAANFPADMGEGGTGMSLGLVTGSLDEYILNVQLSALEDDQKLNILSSPSITTMDNQKAIIESGARIPFQTVDEEGNINTEFEDAALKLEVVPHIIDNRVVKLNIRTNKDEVDFSRTTQGNPTIITKRAGTNLLLHDGQTTVIGGLSKQTSTDSESGMPWLKNIPGLGYLFKSSLNSNQMEDVLIFITPHIIKEKAPKSDKQN